jgi:homoserine O-succinyltransferase
MHICWGAQAGLYYHYGIKKHMLDKKIFGIYSQKVLLENCPLLKEFDDEFNVPQSRYSEVSLSDIQSVSKLQLLATSEISGAHLISDKMCRQIFITGHIEYDRDTLKNEYFRDLNRELKIDLPYNYFPDDNSMKEPVFSWRGHANLMYSNWLNLCVYQESPFDIIKMSPIEI